MVQTVYLDRPVKWEEAAEYAKKTRLLGFDTETYGHEVEESSPAYRAKIHVWSIAFLTPELHPYGYRRARGAVLPASALPYFKDVLADERITKVAHNARHDCHACENHGCQVAGVTDTLDLVRLAYPERALDPRLGFRLKPLARDLLGKPKRDEYKDIVHETTTSLRLVKRNLGCACGVKGCKKRKGAEHEKLVKLEEVKVNHLTIHPLESITPDHPRWGLLLPYAGADAEDALELYDLTLRKLSGMQSRLPPPPW